MATNTGFVNCTAEDLENLFAGIMEGVDTGENNQIEEIEEYLTVEKPKPAPTAVQPLPPARKNLTRPVSQAKTPRSICPPLSGGGRTATVPQRVTTNRKRKVPTSDPLIDAEPIDLSSPREKVGRSPTHDLSSGDDTEKKTVDWKNKPILVNSFSYDLNVMGNKTVSIGNFYSDGFPVTILFSKLDSPNAFVLMSPEEWFNFKKYFEILDNYFKGSMTPIAPATVGRHKLTFKKWIGKPAIVIGNEDGKLLMMGPVFARLKQTSFLIDLCIKEMETRRLKLNEFCTSQCDIRESSNTFHLYAELLRCEALYRKD